MPRSIVLLGSVFCAMQRWSGVSWTYILPTMIALIVYLTYTHPLIYSLVQTYGPIAIQRYFADVASIQSRASAVGTSPEMLSSDADAVTPSTQ